MLCMLYGVVTIVLTAIVIAVAYMSMKSAYCTQVRKAHGAPLPTFRDDLHSLLEENIHGMLMAFPSFGIIAFTVIPLIFMILIAFTSYDRDHQPPGNLFDWVGMANFTQLFTGGSRLATTFWPVLGWTLIWAVAATSTNFILGMLLALLINQKVVRGKGFWRFLFVLSIAVPQFVSLLSMRTIFNANGPVNVILRTIGVLQATESIPFFTNELTAKLTAQIESITLESDVENLIRAKGFVDCVAFISEGQVNITVMTTNDGLTKEEVAQIRDIVLSKCSVSVQNITVVEVK